MLQPTIVKRSRSEDGSKELRVYMTTYPNRVEYMLTVDPVDGSTRPQIKAVSTLPESVMDAYYEMIMEEDIWEEVE